MEINRSSQAIGNDLIQCFLHDIAEKMPKICSSHDLVFTPEPQRPSVLAKSSFVDEGFKGDAGSVKESTGLQSLKERLKAKLSGNLSTSQNENEDENSFQVLPKVLQNLLTPVKQPTDLEPRRVLMPQVEAKLPECNNESLHFQLQKAKQVLSQDIPSVEESLSQLVNTTVSRKRKFEETLVRIFSKSGKKFAILCSKLKFANSLG